MVTSYKPKSSGNQNCRSMSAVRVINPDMFWNAVDGTEPRSECSDGDPATAAAAAMAAASGGSVATSPLASGADTLLGDGSRGGGDVC